MKRKMTWVLALALVLLSMSVTAIAAAIMNHVFEQVIDMEVKNGPFYTWNHEERLQLLDLLLENDFDFPEDQVREIRHTSDPQKQSDLVTQLLTDTFGREDALSHFDIIESVKGPMSTWSLEDKAWYSDCLRSKKSLLDSWRDVLPEKTDMSSEEAVHIAKQTVLSAFSLDEGALDSMLATVSFFVDDDHASPRWYIEFSHGPYDSPEYAVLLTRDGQVTEDESLMILSPEHEAERRGQAAVPPTVEPTHTLSLEEKAALDGQENGLPSQEEIDEALALAIARDAITSLGLDPTQYTTDLWYKRYDPYDSTRRGPYYCIYFTDDPAAPNDVYCVIIDPRDGTVLQTTYASESSSG